MSNSIRMGGVTYTAVLITPRMAQNWLDVNTGNRKLREGVAEKYADDMSNRRWTHCGDSILFYADGTLANGQHRLWAIVLSDTPQYFLVGRGLPKPAGLNIDTLTPRTLVDNADISGVDHNLDNTIVALARAVHEGTPGIGRGAARSNGARLEMISLHREACDWVVKFGPTGRGLRNSAVLGAVARAWYHEKNHKKLARFCEVLSTGFLAGEHESAAVAIRNYLYSKPGLTTTAMWRDTFLKVQNAIGAFMQDRKLMVIRPVAEEIYPLPEEKVTSKPRRPTVRAARAELAEALA